jgi:hypothetical protein
MTAMVWRPAAEQLEIIAELDMVSGLAMKAVCGFLRILAAAKGVLNVNSTDSLRQFCHRK